MSFEIRPAPRTAPHRPAVRAGVRRGFNTYTAPAADVTVEAWPHRPTAHARQLARRFHRDPAALAMAVQMRMPGITRHLDYRTRGSRAA